MSDHYLLHPSTEVRVIPEWEDDVHLARLAGLSDNERAKYWKTQSLRSDITFTLATQPRMLPAYRSRLEYVLSRLDSSPKYKPTRADRDEVATVRRLHRAFVTLLDRVADEHARLVDAREAEVA